MARNAVRLTLIVVALLAVGAGFVLFREWRFRDELARATRELQRGRSSAAHRRLVRLVQNGWSRPELEYRLGLSEQALGRGDAAVAAWRKIPLDSTFGPQAAALRATALINRGRFAQADALLTEELPPSGRRTPDVREVLGRLYRFEGRVDEVRRLIEESWPDTTDRAGLLKRLWEHDILPWPVDGVQAVLEKAPSDDDRVWLGRANLAIMTGHFSEANRWLTRCLQKRPTDPAVWRSRLNLARAAGDLDGLRAAISHLAAEQFTESEILGIRVWLAARLNKPETELHALEALIDYDPADVRAIERAAELEVELGRPERAAERRRRKAELDAAKERYRLLLGSGDPREKLPELARLARTLGRRFEAEGWGLLAAAAGKPAAPADRPSETGPTSEPLISSVMTRLGDRVSDLLPQAPAQPTGAEAKASRPRFADDAESAGLRFVFDHGATRLHHLPETMSGGIGVVDYDGDGWLDVYAIQGGPFPPANASEAPGDRLFRNDGSGGFVDVTAASGLPTTLRGYGLGVAVGDYDNDGFPDIFVTRWRSYELYHNRGDGTFQDVTLSAGLGGERIWPTSAAFADLDNDGDLDLYVCHYCTWDPRTSPPCVDPKKDEYIYCDPKMITGAPDRLFRNDDGHFVDVTQDAGIDDADGRGLGVLAAHLDDDAQIDLLVANDMTANYLFLNRGNLRFEETAQQAGIAGNAGGGFQAGMGVACGDLDRDGLADVAVTNSYNESTTLYHNLGGGMFADWSIPSGVAAATRYLVGFGLVFLDYDNDGYLDIMSANGNLNDARPLFPFPMPAQLLAGRPGGRFREVSGSAGPPWSLPRLGRGLASADLDNDGRTDALIVGQGAPLGYFHNRTDGGHSVAVRLIGRASNRDGVGARLTLTSGDGRWAAERTGGGSYQSASDGRVHFGLGTATEIDRLEILWPSGRRDRIDHLAADTGYDVTEGTDIVRRWSLRP